MWPVTILLLMFAACGEGLVGDPPIDNPPDDRPLGESSFVSADGDNGQQSHDNSYGDADSLAGAEESDRGSGERTVEEGDIYRVMSGSMILNLNAYRGLQVIDFSDVQNPEMIGRLQASGSPVEMYTVGTTAFVLLNNWRGYYGSVYESELDSREGGYVVSVDLSDPRNPRMIDQAHIPGNIQTSRLTRGEDEFALYVVTGGWAEWELEDGTWEWESRTVVMSFDVSDGSLQKRSQLDLGGFVDDIQATTEALLVARSDYSYRDGRTQVSVIDISDPGGTMVEGDEVEIHGWIDTQFNLDMYRDVLRVVSDGRWSSNVNYLQTFDASDIHNLEPIDSVTFGEGEDLYATLFLGNSAFFVTFRQTDPFHAFYIGDNGYAMEMSEFIVSGWNDYFRDVFGASRLIGIGTNDDGGRTMAVSLYDITDLTNPEPLLARSEVEADRSYSEASWDHRAFSVLEDAVEIEGPDGVLETGLVLLPFQGWDSGYDTYHAGVQIFTFSETTLTRRGNMDHGSPVRRSFEADGRTTANLSEQQLSLFDATDPDDPEEMGRVDLAPNYTEYLAYGDYGVRLRDSRSTYYWWSYDAELPPAVVEIIPRSAHPDVAAPVAEIEISANANIHQVDDLLVTTEWRIVETEEYPYTYETDLVVYDLSDPANPIQVAELTTDRLQPSYGGYYYGGYGYYGDMDGIGERGCYGGYYGGNSDDIQAVDDALVFLTRHQERELVGHEETCSTYPNEWEDCWDGDLYSSDCSYFNGAIRCSSLDGAEPVCTGEIQECSYNEDGEWDCVEIDPDTIETETYCWDYDRYRYWNRFTFDILDLSTPAAANLAAPISMPLGDEGLSFLVDGSDIWISTMRPYTVEEDSRSYIRYFIKRMDLSTPSAPVAHDSINVPGQLLAIDGDTAFTRDTVWGEEIVESAIARLILHDGVAYLQGWRVFPDQVVYGMELDGAGHALVSHRTAWYAHDSSTDYYDEVQHMTVLDANSSEFSVLADVEVDSWATLQGAQEGRALFQVPGGLLVFNLDEVTAPYPQAYFPTLGWPTDILIDSDEVIFAAGRYGIYSFDINIFNLLVL